MAQRYMLRSKKLMKETLLCKVTNNQYSNDKFLVYLYELTILSTMQHTFMLAQQNVSLLGLKSGFKAFYY